MSRISKLSLIYFSVLGMGGCALTPGAVCNKAGYGNGMPGHDSCIRRVKAEYRAQGERDLGNALVIGGVVSGYYAPAPASIPPPRNSSPWAVAQPLRKQWSAANGNQMCQYADGTVLNVGFKSCPASVMGQ